MDIEKVHEGRVRAGLSRSRSMRTRFLHEVAEAGLPLGPGSEE